MRILVALPLALLLVSCSKPPGTVSDACVQLLECVATVAADSSSVTSQTYGGESSCWDTADAAEACTVECQDALEIYHAEHPTQSACDDGVETGSNILFPSAAGFVFQNEVNNAQCDPEVGVTLIEIRLEPAVTPTFTWSGELHGAVGDTGFQSTYASDCELDDTDWTCTEDPITTNVGDLVIGRFNLSGTFSATGETSTAVFTYDISDTSGACTQSQSMSGAQE